MTRSTPTWRFLIGCLLFCLPLPPSLSITLSCYAPNSLPRNLYQSNGEVLVDCSLHGFSAREELFFHKSDLCRTTPSLCDQITAFDYSYNAFRYIKKSRYEFPMMNRLNFAHNKIDMIENGAFVGNNLRLVDLSHNKVTGDTLSGNTFQGKFNQTLQKYEMSRIEKLLLGYNEIAYLKPKTFFYLKRLTTLELTSNPLTVIGDSTVRELQSLPLLVILHLGSTNVTQLPTAMFAGMRLETLYLNGNKLAQVPNFAPLSNSLLSLNLDNNLLTELNEDSFPILRYLSNLNISANPHLHTIRQNTFSHLPNLQTLYCNYNSKLSFIHPYAFNDGWLLKELYINNNAITSLPHELGDWDSLDLLDIQSNPWSCDCSIQWLIDYVAKRQRTDPELNYNLHCSEPDKFNGIHILSNTVLSHISGECVKGVMVISKLSTQMYKLYPLLFIMTLLLLTLVAYLLTLTYRYARSHAPYVCNYTVQYNKLTTRA